MNSSPQDDKIAKLSFASVYPHYITKVERKGRSKAELLEVIEWLTGYKEADLQVHIDQNQVLASSLTRPI